MYKVINKERLHEIIYSMWIEAPEVASSVQPGQFIILMIKEKGDMIHHFCLLTDNIEEDLESLKQRGVEMMDQTPRVGLRGKKIWDL